MITTKEEAKDNAQWLSELSSPEVQDALVTLIQKLPQIKEAVVKVEQGVEIISSFATDTQTLDHLAQPIDQFAKIALNKDNLEALATIMDKLPRIAKTVEMLDRVSPFIESVANKDSLVTAAEVLEVVAAPVTERVQDGMSMVKEAKARAAQYQTNISIFGLLKLLKDPAVQDGLKFTQAFLEILSEKRVRE